jgi:hypothetical protein
MTDQELVLIHGFQENITFPVQKISQQKFCHSIGKLGPVKTVLHNKL